MSAIGKHIVELAYKYLESNGLDDSDENWEKAMKAVCGGETINEKTK